MVVIGGTHQYFFVMVVLGTTIHEFLAAIAIWPMQTRGWSDQVRP
jgi:hypothetical protein